MTNNNLFDGEIFSILLTQAKSVLKATPDEVRTKFPLHPVYFVRYIRQGTPELIMEIRFEEAKTTLACEFGSEDNCLNAYLLPDYTENIGDYVTYLDERYEFEFLKYKWTLSDCILSIRIVKNICYFMFTCRN